MSMKQNGLAKLIEECGEVLQVAGKMIEYPELQLNSVDSKFEQHPDGEGDLRVRLEKELGDLRASINFVVKKLNLDIDIVYTRSEAKLTLFKKWDNEQ
jgi:NTP pyrophosphatase (non-canonical NTP hydrolase)